MTNLYFESHFADIDDDDKTPLDFAGERLESVLGGINALLNDLPQNLEQWGEEDEPQARDEALVSQVAAHLEEAGGYLCGARDELEKAITAVAALAGRSWPAP